MVSDASGLCQGSTPRLQTPAPRSPPLPALVAIDALLSRADRALPDSWLANIGVSELSWGAVCGMPKERIAYQSDVFADLHFAPATELALTTTATLRRHFFTLLRPSNASYPLNAVRELFS